MKPLIPILTVTVLTAIIIIIVWYSRPKPVTFSQPLRLEQILSIKELHLVKHVYQDLIFLHKKNNQTKAIRAIVQVPVEITAYLNLKEIQVIYRHDSIKQVVLPHARMNEPRYKIDQMVVRQTHALQVHFGKDLYPDVAAYLSILLKERMDTVRNLAVSNRILVQAEVEGKTYIESLLKAAGREDVIVTFGEDETNRQIIKYNANEQKWGKDISLEYKQARLEELSFGFIPLPDLRKVN